MTDLLLIWIAGVVVMQLLFGWFGEGCDDVASLFFVSLTWPFFLIFGLCAAAVYFPFWLGKKIRKGFK